MKLAIVGSRNINDYQILEAAIKEYNLIPTSIVSGGADGVDTLAFRYAKQNNIPIVVFKPDWRKYGKSAGFKRNIQIVESSDVVLAIWDGKSKGTKHSIDLANKAKKLLFIKLCEGAT